jgi:hypothetical protein
MSERVLKGPATDKQKKFMKEKGIRFGHKIGKQEASNRISKYINRPVDTSYDDFLAEQDPEFAAYLDEINNSGDCPNGMF